MNVPQFTAEASLYKTSEHYHTDRRTISSARTNAVYSAAMGQDFPGATCTCKGCGGGGGDVTGSCSSVCNNKTVYAKGSEPHDYCKAEGLVRPPSGLIWFNPGGGLLNFGP
jgi:hypothetical protein